MATFGSLFAGIGGIDLGLERAGWECRFQVEWDAYCQRVLAKHWPDVPRYGDITAVDWSGVERVDLLAGGFPCQPVSYAGLGRAQDDARWLWPEFRRAVGALRPGYVLVENVPGLLARGLGDVLGDLAALGYDTEWDCIPAAALGAPHRRDRVWIVAYANSGRLPIGAGGGLPAEPRLTAWADSGAGGSDVADPDGGRQQQRHEGERRLPIADAGGHVPDARSERGQLPPQRRLAAIALARRNGSAGGAGSGPGEWWATEPDVGRVAHGVPARVDRLRALGNAVVPQVVEVIGRQLLASLEQAA